MLVRINGWVGQIAPRTKEKENGGGALNVWHGSCNWVRRMNGGRVNRKNWRPITVSILLLIAIAVTAIMPTPGANPSWSSDAAKFYQVADADYITPFFVSPVSV